MTKHRKRKAVKNAGNGGRKPRRAPQATVIDKNGRGHDKTGQFV